MIAGQLFFDGLAMGVVFVVLACGMVLIMSVNKIMFLTYGVFYTIGAYATWYAMNTTGMNYFIALVIGIAFASGLGMLCHVFVFKQLQKVPRSFLSTLIASVGLMLILTQGGVLIYGPLARNIPSVFPGTIEIAGIILTNSKIMLMAMSMSIGLALFWIYTKTAFGRSMQAVAYLPEAAALQGVNHSMILLFSMALGCGMAGAAGGILAPTYGMNPNMGTMVIWTVLLMCMFGGMNSLLGAVFGGLVVGQALSFGQFYIGSAVQIVVFIGIMVLLYFRPHGLLGTEQNLGV